MIQERHDAPPSGVLLRENAEPPGCIIYYAVDAAGHFAFRVVLDASRAGPEWREFLERQAQRIARVPAGLQLMP